MNNKKSPTIGHNKKSLLKSEVEHIDITSFDSRKIIEGLEKIRSEAAQGAFQVSEEDEDVHFAVERRLIDLLGPLGKKLHTARSRNDQVGTDLRLWLRRRIDEIDCQLVRFQKALLIQLVEIWAKRTNQSIF